MRGHYRPTEMPNRPGRIPAPDPAPDPAPGTNPGNPSAEQQTITDDWEQIKHSTLARNFKQVPLNSVIVTAAVGMQQQGNIQGLGIQHQLADDLRPNDLTQFENLLEERGVHHHFDPATLRDRLAIYPQDAGTQPDPDQHNPCRTVTWSSTPP